MDATLRYEIKAGAFYRMTRILAPGKDEPPTYSTDYATRARAWSEWHEKYGEVIESMLWAMDQQLDKE